MSDRQKVVFVCGSFKPPHKNHVKMIQHYSSMADRVYVIISDPERDESKRETVDGGFISPNTSLEIFGIYSEELNLGENVRFMISESPAPVQTAIGIMNTLENCDIIMGVGDKDAGRFDDLYKSFKPKNGSKMIDPNTTMFHLEDDGGISGTFMRKNLNNEENLIKCLPDGLSERAVNNIMELLSQNDQNLTEEIASYASIINEEYEEGLRNGTEQFFSEESVGEYDNFISEIRECLSESKEDEKAKASVLDVLERLKSEIKDPNDVEKFMGKYASQIQNIEKNLSTPEQKSSFSKVMGFVTSGMKKGWSFLKKNWGKVLIALAIILLYIYWPKAAVAGSIFGKWFGDGNGEGIPADVVDAPEVQNGVPGDGEVDINADPADMQIVDPSQADQGNGSFYWPKEIEDKVNWDRPVRLQNIEGMNDAVVTGFEDKSGKWHNISYDMENVKVDVDEALKDVVKGRMMTNPKDGKKHPQFTVDPSEFETYKNKDMLKKHGAQWYTDRNDPSKSGWNWTAWDDDVEKILNGKIKPTLDEIAKMNGDDPAEVLTVIEFLKNEIKVIQDGGEGRTVGGLRKGNTVDTSKTEEEIKNKLEELEQKLVKITSAQEFQDFMKPILAFKKTALYKYSLVNCILIQIQDPEARAVLSGSRWAQKNREILPDAKMIALWVPQKIKYSAKSLEYGWLKRNGYKSRADVPTDRIKELDDYVAYWSGGEITKFYMRQRFTDIRFTKVMDGKDDKMAEWEQGMKNLNDLVWFDDKQEATQSTVEIANALVNVCKNHNIDLDYEDIKGGARGYATNNGKTIRLNNGEEVSFDFLKTGVHELTHALCHFKDSKYKLKDDYDIQEQEAEICAWMVCYLFGYEDPNNTSLNYVGGWGITDEKLAVNIFRKMNGVAVDIYDEIIEEVKKARKESK